MKAITNHSRMQPNLQVRAITPDHGAASNHGPITPITAHPKTAGQSNHDFNHVNRAPVIHEIPTPFRGRDSHDPNRPDWTP
jgi:hypothetical protein